MATHTISSAMDRSADALGRSLDAIFGAEHNPWHQLGALGFYLFWIIAVTGFYVYALFETSATGAWASVEDMSRHRWQVASLMRGVHRYASDAFVVVTAAHLLREFLRGHWRSFRWFSWLTGVPLIWLLYASGLGGYWLVWDQLAHFSIVATAEWLDWLPLGGQAIIRNFIHPIDDRFFSLLIFLHIGIPLILLLVMWVHIQRISRVRTVPTRRLGVVLLTVLVVTAFVAPARSHAPADPLALEAQLALDWFYMFVHPMQYASSPALLWLFAGGGTLILALLPLFGQVRRPVIARVDPSFCNGCERCVDDCPYAAIVMQPRVGGRAGQRIPVVDPDACAACGICAGACPSSTPFRSTDALLTGIDLPDLTIAALRTRLEAGLQQAGIHPVVVFACERAAQWPSTDATDAVLALNLRCVGMLPPSFVEYALRAGARAVVVNACRPGECEFRLGARWIDERLAGAREPHLRSNVDRTRVLRTDYGRGEEASLAAVIDDAKRQAAGAAASAPPKRRSVTGD